MEEEKAGQQKNEATARILALLRMLGARSELTRQEIFERLPQFYPLDRQASDRKFERDIAFLEEQGYEVEHLKEKGLPTHYRLVQGSGAQPLLVASGSEIDALILLFNMFANPNTYTSQRSGEDVLPLPSQPSNPFAQAALAMIERIVALLPEDQRRLVERGVRKPYVYFNVHTLEDYFPHRETIDHLIEAISWRRQIRFEYLPQHRSSDSIMHERIDPYYVFFGEGHFYLLGYSYKTGQHLEFRVDRIKSEGLTILPTMIDVERRRRPTEFSYWISGDIAKRGLSQRWLSHVVESEETYQERGREKRRVLVRATAYSEWRIIQQMLRYGDQAELVGPPRLRESMRKTVARMAGMYEPKDQDW